MTGSSTPLYAWLSPVPLCVARPHLGPCVTTCLCRMLQSFGLSRAVMLLKGSKSKQVEGWMQELAGPDGTKLHGAGSARSDEWWKGLGNVLMGQGLLASKTKSVRPG